MYIHGDVGVASLPHLRALLDGLVVLAPTHLVLDVSAVGRLSPDGLHLIQRCGHEIGTLSLRSPSPAVYSDLVELGYAALVEGGRTGAGADGCPVSPDARTQRTAEWPGP